MKEKKTINKKKNGEDKFYIFIFMLHFPNLKYAG